MRKKITKNISTAFLISILAFALLSTNSFAERSRTVNIPYVDNLQITEVTTTSVTLDWDIPNHNGVYLISENQIAAFEIYKDNVLQEVVPSTVSVVRSQSYPHWSHRISGLYESSSQVFSIKIRPIASITDYVAQTASITVTTPTRSVPGVYYIPYGDLPCSYLNHGGIVGKVQFNTIDNTSTSFDHVLRYSDFTGVSTNVAKGATYNLTIKSANPISTSYPIGPVSYAAWIDFNRNFKFDPDELVLTKNLTTDGTATVSVTIPTAAVEGPTRLRVLVNDIESKYMGPVEPVHFTTLGEFEDYTINILDTQAPTAPSNLAVSNVSGTSLTLNWTASTDNIAVTGYDVYSNGTLLTTVTSTTANITGLVQGTTYNFYVKAKDAAGNVSTTSNTISTTTLDMQAPTAPTGLAATDIKGTSLTLRWTPSTDNVGVAGYDVYKDGALLTTVTTNEANITGLSQYTNYKFYVKAKDAAGNVSAASSTLSATTADTQAPTDPSNIVVSNITGTSLTLTWNASTDNVAVTGYDVFQGDTFLTTVASNSVKVTGLVANTSYSFSIRAKDAAGNTSILLSRQVTTADTEAPTVPTNLIADNIGTTALVLYWKPSTDNLAVTSYDVYMNNAFLKNIPVNLNTATISGLTPNSAYSFYVKAKDAAGNVSAASNTVSVKTTDTQAPTAPTNLKATNISARAFSLSWTTSTDNVGVASYGVYLNGVAQMTVTTNSVSLASLYPGAIYEVYVVAKDAAGNVSAASATLSVALLDTQAPTAPANLAASNVTETSLTLNWTASKDNAVVTGYDVYRNGTFLTTVATNTANITGLARGASYTFYVVAKDASGNVSAASNTISVALQDKQAPSTPTNLAASSITASSLTLSWTASSDNVAVKGYDVYRDGVLYTTTTSNTINISRLSSATTYKFYVKAKDAAGNVSAASNTVSVTTTGGTRSLVIDGEEATAAATKIVIYPNPTEAQLFLSDIERIESIYIFDSFGKQVYGAKATKEINVTGLTNGVYLIRLKFKDGSTDTSRFIKK